MSARPTSAIDVSNNKVFLKAPQAAPAAGVAESGDFLRCTRNDNRLASDLVAHSTSQGCLLKRLRSHSI